MKRMLIAGVFVLTAAGQALAADMPAPYPVAATAGQLLSRRGSLQLGRPLRRGEWRLRFRHQQLERCRGKFRPGAAFSRGGYRLVQRSRHARRRNGGPQ